MPFRALLLIAVCVVFLSRSAAAGQDGITVIRSANIVDVERGVVIPARDVVLRGGLIESINAPGWVSPDPAHTVEVNAAGLYLMPGLFDAHVHLIADIESYPTMLVAHGVTAARDLGAPTEAIVALRGTFAAGDAVGPTLFVTGAIIDGDPPVWPFSEPVDTPEEGRAAVRKLKDAGVDMIKVYTRLNKDVYEAVVDEAHRLGLKATGHIPESVTLAEAMEAGQDCDEHLMRIDAAIAALAGHPEERNRDRARMSSGWVHLDEVPAEKLAELAAKIKAAGMAHCPTIIVMAGIGRADQEDALQDPMMAYVSRPSVEFWAGPVYRMWAPGARSIVPAMKKTVAAFQKAGVTLMVGTDLANPFVFAGKAVHEEMALWQEAGIAPADVLRAATIVPATFCGASDRLGSIALGKQASLVLTRKNPLEDVRNASEIEHVFLRGQGFDRAAIDSMLAKIKDSVAGTAPAAAPEEAKVELPGEVVARGKYTMKFGPFPAGEEEFVISKTDSGYHIFADNRPQGGGQIPYTMRVDAELSGRVTEVVWKQAAVAPVVATYTIAGGELKAATTKSGEPVAPQILAFGDKELFSLPTYAGDFLTLRMLNLKPGESREMNGLWFGSPDWRVQSMPTKISRMEDTTIDRAGVATACSYYTSEIKTPVGVFKVKSWHDNEYLSLRTELVMPFGTLTVERD